MSRFEVTRGENSLQMVMCADLKNIDRVSKELKAFFKQQGLEAYAFDILLVMREALSNAMIHGCSKDGDKQVDFHLKFEGCSLTMRVADNGPGFEWSKASLTAPRPDSTRGRGLSIMKNYFDAMEYNAQGNVVVLTKHCQEGACMSTMQHSTDAAVVKPGRDIVSSMAQAFKLELKDYVDKGVKELTVDLDGVELIDSIGMGLLIAAHNSLMKNGGKLKVVNPSEDILRLLRTMRLDKHFEVLSS